MKKTVLTTLSLGLLFSTVAPLTSHAESISEPTPSYITQVNSTPLQELVKTSSVPVIQENGEISIQAVPPSTKWKVVDHFRGNSKNIDTAAELGARIAAGLPGLKYFLGWYIRSGCVWNILSQKTNSLLLNNPILSLRQKV